MKRFPHYRQLDQYDCGPACLRIIAKYYGIDLPLQKLREFSETTREGSSLKGLSDAAEWFGFRTMAIRVGFKKLTKEAPLPCILHWTHDHFVVIYRIKNGWIHISDPAFGLVKYRTDEFLEKWTGNRSGLNKGVALLVQPTQDLTEEQNPRKEESKKGITSLKGYVLKYRKFVSQLILGLIAGSLLQLTFPFLTQSIVDVGIRNRDLHFIYLILLGQVFLFIGKMSVEAIRSWILLHLSKRINIEMVSDFFMKLMRLPISYFDTRITGDLIQRIHDHRRIEQLLTTTSLNTLFSLSNLVIFGAVLAFYNLLIFIFFLVGTTLYFLWIIVFLKKRRILDHKQFDQLSDEQSKVIEIMNGMQEIKLHNAEKKKRWEWERIQARLFRIDIQSLALEQKQRIGSSFINELKNILITTFSAKLVIDGELTLGMMLSISYILGQLNTPINQILHFIHSIQDSGIALERLNDIHGMEEEGSKGSFPLRNIPADGEIALDSITFRYQSASDPVFKELSLTIPPKRTTAIVGTSGSGKTTLVKMLLGFYAPSSGHITIGGMNLRDIPPSEWRKRCGVVMQEGFIFEDSIHRNIAVGEERVDPEKLQEAIRTANLSSLVNSLPLGTRTKIGDQEGTGLSTGQKQRILIARAVYKDPPILFFDEATSALDANNEKEVMENLRTFTQERTSVIIAHRLSTVRKADKIVVLDNGRIAEQGDHATLIERKGRYYELVKDQLELERMETKDA